MSDQSDLRRLAVPKFNGKNFPVWKHRISLILQEADVWDIVIHGPRPPLIDESSEEPEGRILQDAAKGDVKARRIITSGSIDEHVALTVSCTTARSMWELLETINEKSGTSNRLFLRQRFFKLKMDESGTMLDHIAALETLSRQIISAGSQLEDDDVVMTLLGSLPDSYSTLVTALEARDGDLSLTDVKAKLLHEEAKQRSATASTVATSGTEKALFAAKPYRDQGKRRQPKDTKNDKCFHCGKMGHWKRKCRKYLAEKRDGNGHRRNQHGSVVEEGVTADDGPAEIFLTNEHKDSYIEDHSFWLHTDWSIDSGASSHISNNASLFESIDYTRHKDVMVGDGRILRCKGIGSISAVLTTHGRESKVLIKDVRYIPEISCNLISVPQLVKKGLNVKFGTTCCEVFSTKGAIIAVAEMKAALWKLQARVIPSQTERLLTVLRAKEAELWHKRLGHVNRDVVRSLAKWNLIQGVAGGMNMCEPCVMGKQHRTSFKKSSSETEQPLELVHSEICGPMKIISKGGARYFALSVDDYTRFAFVHFLKRKGDVQDAFKNFMVFAEKQFGYHLKVLRTDNGGEYTKSSFEEFLSQVGVIHESSIAYTPQQNGVAERMNRTVKEMARTMLLQSTFDGSFWAEAISTAVYLRNRVPGSSIKNEIPYRRLYGAVPRLTHLRVFGCLAFAKRLAPTVETWDCRSEKCLMLGYSTKSKAYRLWSLENHCILKAIDVVFDEQSHDKEEKIVAAEANQTRALVDMAQRSETGTEDVEIAHSGRHQSELFSERDIEAVTHYPHIQEATEKSPANSSPTERRYSVRHREVTRRYSPTESQSELVNLIQHAEPSSLQEALSSADKDEWRRALDEEMKSLLNNSTWTLVELPAGRQAVECKWIFKRKLDVNGKVERFKVRLVAKGFLQREGIDYFDTFAPVCKFTSLRCVLTIGAVLDLEIHQMDVKTALLNGELQEEVYMCQPPGYEESPTHMVCRLQKALYGLKQAPSAWYAKLSSFLVHIGFAASGSDHGSFVKGEGVCRQYILAYVDDLVIAAKRLEDVVQIKAKLSEAFDMSDLGQIGKCLGLDIKRDGEAQTITLSQSHYVVIILERFSMQNSRPTATPLDAGLALTASRTDGIDKRLRAKYQKLIGSVVYAILGSRPDISFAVIVLSRFTANPSLDHWKAAKHLLRYLRGTSDMCLVLGISDGVGANDEITIEGFCDSDWASDRTDRRSTSGYTFKVNGSTIAWQTKKQPTVALSTVEAEYLALSAAVKEAIWLRLLLKEMGFEQKRPTVVWEDNQGCIALAKNPKFHQRSKHIDVRRHFIREKVTRGIIKLEYIPTDKAPADGLTKSLRKTAHNYFISGISLKPARGSN